MEFSEFSKNVDNIEKSKQIEKNPISISSNKMEKLVNFDGNTYIIDDPEVKIIEEQKTYFWSRLFLKEEYVTDLEIGDIVSITYRDEYLEAQFISYGFKNLEKDHNDQIVYAEQEVDDKILILMIDEKEVNYGTNISFIQTLFKNSMHYQYEIYKRSELLFTNKRTGNIIDYFDADL